MRTIRDLIDTLERLAAEYGDDVQPRIATINRMRGSMEYPIADVDVIDVSREAADVKAVEAVEVDCDPVGNWAAPHHIVYLVAENVGDGLAFEAQRVLRG